MAKLDPKLERMVRVLGAQTRLTELAHEARALLAAFPEGQVVWDAVFGATTKAKASIEHELREAWENGARRPTEAKKMGWQAFSPAARKSMIAKSRKRMARIVRLAKAEGVSTAVYLQRHKGDPQLGKKTRKKRQPVDVSLLTKAQRAAWERKKQQDRERYHRTKGLATK